MIQTFNRNTLGRDFVVGDIHGCFDLLDIELSKVDFDVSKDRLFCVGDLIDRGPFSNKVAEFLSQDHVYSVMGNHEDILLDIYEFGEPQGMALYNSMANGLEWWLKEGGQSRRSILEALSRLPLVIEIRGENSTVGIIHADVEAGISWEEFKRQLPEEGFAREDCLWGRRRVMSGDCSGVEGLSTLFVGHTPGKSVRELGNVVCIDTGAFASYNSSKGYTLTLLEISDKFYERR